MPMANPIHWEATDPDVLWSPGNVSEAIPGVSTPLNWSFVGDAIELAGRRGFAALGVLAPGEVRLRPRAEDRFIVAFFGRTVANIEKMRLIGDRMPGASANGIEQQLFGVVRDGVENHPSYRRWPVVAVRMPAVVAGLCARQTRARAALVTWWRAQVLAPPADAAAARVLPSGSGPDQNERAQADQRASAEAELCAALGRLRAPGARLVLRLARALIPQREIGKANYTQALDAARLAARVLGSSLAAEGRLSD